MSIESVQELKKLSTQLQQAQGSLEAVRQEVANARRKEEAERASLKVIQQRIDVLIKELEESPEPSVTEHAMLRYVERVMGISLEDVEDAILSDATKAAVKFAKSGKHKRNDCTVVFRDNVIVTIHTKELV